MKLGLIGCGRWGKIYISSIQQMSEIELSHLATSNPENKKIVSDHCRVSQKWQDVAQDKTLDGIIIATPPATHYEIAELAIKSGIPVLIEKPMTLSLVDAKKIMELAKEFNVLIMVGHTHLYSSAFREMKHIGKNLGILKSIISFGGNQGPYREDVSALWDYAPHDIAMCCELFEQFPKAISIKKNAQILPKDGNGMGESNSITLEFGIEQTAKITVSNIESCKKRYLEAHYELGSLIFDDLKQEDKLQLKTQNNILTIPLSSVRPLNYMIAEFCQKISIGLINDSSLRLGVQVIEILDFCKENNRVQEIAHA